jgi:hypothetical protein
MTDGLIQWNAIHTDINKTADKKPENENAYKVDNHIKNRGLLENIKKAPVKKIRLELITTPRG